jgi:hypothetical protein
MRRFLNIFGELKEIKTVKHQGLEILITSMDEESVTDDFVSIGLRFEVENEACKYYDYDMETRKYKKHWISIGTVQADFEYYSLEEIKEMDCADDMLSLLEDWGGKPFWDKNKIPTLEITLSALEPEYRNKKIGYLMYQELALTALKVYKFPLLFTANYCLGGKTSPLAKRLWSSLRRKNKKNSSGDVLLIAPNSSKYTVQ